MNDLDAIRLVYFEECDELLVELDRGLQQLAANGPDAETINAIFRAVHSIKGGAGAFGLERLVRFAHRVENILDDLRSGRFTPTDATCDLLFQASDRLADLVGKAKIGDEQAVGDETLIAEALEAHARQQASSDSVPEMPPGDDPFDLLAGLSFTPVPVSLETPASVGRWRLTLAPSRTLYACGDDIRNALTALAALGSCHTTIVTDALPTLDALDPHDGHLIWNVQLQADVDEAAIRAALEWSIDDLGVSIEPDSGGVVTPPGALQPPATPILSPDPAPSIDMQPARQEAEPTSQSPSVSVSKGQTSIRVDLARVDKLVDLVGELVINQAALHQCLGEIPRHQAAMANTAIANLDHLTRELQEGVMAMRAHPIGAVFQRMGRVVREASAATGKPVRLILSGEDIEVDRSIVEHLVDPLTHILRNAVDHGIEPAAGRSEAHKPPEGEIRLTARHRSDRLVIEISDDGRGIDTERVRTKAIERGLIDPQATIDAAQVHNLIFAPGFSTAAAISDLSGRGVGMDVVKRSITELGGRIVVQSEYGRGTTIILSLPLTLAVLDGMVFRAGGQTFIAPVGHVVESLTPDPAKVFSLSDGSLIYNGRGQHLPVVDVGACLTSNPCINHAHVPLVMIVESEQGQRMALAVDDIVQQSQIVIKSIEKNYARVAGIAAATILGNGDVALIIDVDALVGWQDSRSGHPAIDHDRNRPELSWT
jgi:two-component system, chemotaxis family, sensor kinase CheA